MALWHHEVGPRLMARMARISCTDKESRPSISSGKTVNWFGSEIRTPNFGDQTLGNMVKD